MISIVLVNYNGANFIRKCLASIESQTWKSVEWIFIDNASNDDSIKIFQRQAPKNGPVPIFNTENIGYSRAANQGIRQSTGDFVMIMNPDIILEPDYIEKIMKCAEKHPQAGAFSGKLLKYNFELGVKTNIFDSTGLYCYRNRRMIDRGQGLEDVGQYETEEEVFGVTGAAPVYRREALEVVKIPVIAGQSNVPLRHTPVMVRQAHHDTSEPRHDSVESHHDTEYFDEDFFMYKEDIDLAWRMRLFGWSSYYVPKAIAYHGRGTGVLKRFTHWEVVKNRRHLSRFQKALAYRNQRLMQIKNEILQNLFRDAFHILWKEFLVLAYIVFCEPYMIKMIFDLIRHLPSALKKRAIIMSQRKVTPNKMQRWFQ